MFKYGWQTKEWKSQYENRYYISYITFTFFHWLKCLLIFLILIIRHHFIHLHVIVCRLIRSFPITTKSTHRVWPVSRGCYQLYGSWSNLFFYSFFFYQLLFCTALGAFDFEHCSILPQVMYCFNRCLFSD